MVSDEVPRSTGRVDVGSPTASGVASRRLCIVSRDRPLSGEFVTALTTTLGPGDEFEIIMDRRGDGARTYQPPIERRNHPDVDHALERDGFAIVPMQATRPAKYGSLKVPRVPSASPIERLALTDADARELERILGFKRRRRARPTRWLILAGLLNAILVLVILSPAVKTLLSRARPVAPQVAEILRPTPAPPVAATPSPTPDVRALPRAVRPQSPDARPREATTSTRGLSGPSAAPPKAAPGPSAVAPPATGTASTATPPPVAPLPQADVTRNPAPMSEGGGEAYTVRLSDQAGRPVAGAQVSLVIRMADGSLLDIQLGSGPELGTYHVTVPPLEATPVDLRIRVVTSDKRVEIPLTP